MSEIPENFDDLVLEKQWRRCAPAWDKGPDALLGGRSSTSAPTTGAIRHPERGKILFELREAQIETVDTWLRERYVVVLKARQIGFSTLIATYCFWLTFFYPDRAVIMISKTERESAKLLQKAKYGYRFLPDWMKLRGPMRIENTQSKMTWSNESGIESLPSASDPGRGESVFLVVVDEIGFLPNSEEAYAAIEPIADIGGRIIMLGTANGEGNLLHKLWVGRPGRTTTGTSRCSSRGRPGTATRTGTNARKPELPAVAAGPGVPVQPGRGVPAARQPGLRCGCPARDRPVGATARGYLWKPPDRRMEFVPDGGPLRSVGVPPGTQASTSSGPTCPKASNTATTRCGFVIDAKDRNVVAMYHAHVDTDLFGTDVLGAAGHLVQHGPRRRRVEQPRPRRR